MKRHLSGLAVAILTFVVGWSIPIRILQSSSDGVLVLQFDARTSYAWAVLLAYQNRDLTNLEPPAKARLQLAIDSLVGPIENRFFSARLFSKLSRQEKERYVLVEESPLREIPGDSRLRTSVFAKDGTLVSTSEFGAGWRLFLSNIRFTQVEGIAGEVLEVESTPAINGADIAKQYYALVGDQMRLIRLEDSSGVLTRNVYAAPNYTIGFTLIGRSASEWQNELKSNNSAEVLAALTWLEGLHLNVNRPEPFVEDEYLSEAQLVDGLRARSSVKQVVNELRYSNNQWVREAAKAAAQTIP